MQKWSLYSDDDRPPLCIVLETPVVLRGVKERGDLLDYLCGFLDNEVAGRGVKTMLRISRTCRNLRYIVRDDRRWRRIHQRAVRLHQFKTKISPDFDRPQMAQDVYLRFILEREYYRRYRLCYRGHKKLTSKLKKDKYRVKSRSKDKVATHYMLNGGKFAIPDSEHDFFIQQYAEALRRGERLYFVELRTPIFRMIMDADFFELDVLPQSQIDEFVGLVQRTLSEFYTDDIGDVVLCTTQCQVKTKTVIDPVTDTSKKLYRVKTGLHLIWPDLAVNQKNALWLRSALIQRMEEALGPRPDYNGWDDVIDECVYMGNGLRMVGSRKTENCKIKECRSGKVACDCDGKLSCSDERCKGGKIPCSHCSGWGRMDVGRVYEPVARYDSGGNRTPIVIDPKQSGQFVALHRQLSIRLVGAQSCRKLVVPTWAKPLFTAIAASTKRPRPSGTTGNRGPTRRTRRDTQYERTNIPAGSARHVLVSNVIRQNFKDSPEITKLEMIQSKTPFYQANTKCRWCWNKGEEHSNNNIWFIIDRQGIVQKCFSQNKAQRRETTPCSKWRGFRIPWDHLGVDDAKERLFGFNDDDPYDDMLEYWEVDNEVVEAEPLIPKKPRKKRRRPSRREVTRFGHQKSTAEILEDTIRNREYVYRQLRRNKRVNVNI